LSGCCGYYEQRGTTEVLRAGSATPAEREELHLRKLYHGELLPHLLDRGGVVLGAEDGRTGDEGIGPPLAPLRNFVRLDSPVDREPDVLAQLVYALAHFGDLRQNRRDELLAAEAGVDRHQQHQIKLLERVVEERNRRRRIQHQPGLAAVLLDERDGAIDVLR